MNKKNNLRKNAVQKIQKKISEDFCFQTLCSDIKLTQSAYDYYKEHLTELKMLFPLMLFWHLIQTFFWIYIRCQMQNEVNS